MTTETVPVLTDAEKANFVADIIEYGTDFVAPLYATVDAIEQAVLQSPEAQAWKKDAERYRHLRDEAELSPHDIFNAWRLSDHGNPQTLDAAVDISMEEQP